MGILKMIKLLTLMGVAQLVRFWICFSEIINSSAANLMITGDLHGC